jgi:hypothetical protein
MQLKRLPLARELSLAVVLKIAVLVILWEVFFSTPQTKKMTMPARQVEQHLLSAPAGTNAPSRPSLSSKASDDPAR